MQITVTGVEEASQAFLFTGYIISVISLFYTQVVISYVANSFQYIGLCGFLYASYNNGMMSLFLPICFMLFILSFSLYLTYKYQDIIENKRYPKNYDSFNTAFIWLLLVETIFVYWGISQKKMSSSSLSVLYFLLTLTIIILTTQGVILGDFSTDG